MVPGVPDGLRQWDGWLWAVVHKAFGTVSVLRLELFASACRAVVRVELQPKAASFCTVGEMCLRVPRALGWRETTLPLWPLMR